MKKILFYSTQSYDREYFQNLNKNFGFELDFLEVRLDENTVKLSIGYDGICAFVNDILNKNIIEKLKENNINVIALRCAGFNNVDIETCNNLNIKVLRVPAYSPYAVAEHALALIMTLNRKTHKAYNRVREMNFSLNGLMGFDLKDKNIGVIGTGKIGAVFCEIIKAFKTNIYAYDIIKNPDIENIVEYVDLNTLFEKSDIISLHCPLNENTKYIINEDSINLMKNNVMIINTGRGALIDTKAVVEALKNRKIGYLGIDVYEQEEKLFFKDLSYEIIEDDLISRLITFPNVLITAHQAFFTDNAMSQIVNTTLQNFKDFFDNNFLENQVN